MKLDFFRGWRRKRENLQTSLDVPQTSLDTPSTLYCSLSLRRDGNYCRGCVRDNDTGKDLFDEYVVTKPLMDSLLGSTDASIMTCFCGEPGCAGFWHQESRLSETRVHWLLEYKRENWDLLFDRDAYENAALAVLRQFMENHGETWSCQAERFWPNTLIAPPSPELSMLFSLVRPVSP